VFGSVGGFFGVKYLREKQAQEELDAIVDEQAQMGLDTEYENKNIDEETREFVNELCGTSDPVDILPIISSSELFEQTVIEYKESERFDEEGLEKIYELRNSLEFTFKNLDWAFLNTQMLEKGMKLECEIKHKSRNVVFMTSILDANETHLYIKPPTVKRRPANLKQFPLLHCRLRRVNDADYEFDLEIVEQLIDEMNAVVLLHSSHIQKMTIRVSERVPLNMEMVFQKVTDAQYDLEHKFDAEEQDREDINALIKDMSAGGMKLQLENLQSLEKGDVLIFHLSTASLRRDLAASVMNIVPRGGLYDLHLKFRDNDVITKMKINQYLHRATKNMEAKAS
jgi:c-di-GMP-binding flagellar brake protein YcgR